MQLIRLVGLGNVVVADTVVALEATELALSGVHLCCG